MVRKRKIVQPTYESSIELLLTLIGHNTVFYSKSSFGNQHFLFLDFGFKEPIVWSWSKG